MKVVDGKDAVMGRLASFVAKELLKGEEIAVVNSEEVIITGTRQNVKKEFEESRTKVGSGQKGPKVSRLPERIVKRAIRGMVGNHRFGRGREAFKRVKCYVGVPKEFESAKKISMADARNKVKYVKVKEISK